MPTRAWLDFEPFERHFPLARCNAHTAYSTVQLAEPGTPFLSLPRELAYDPCTRINI